MNFSDSGRRVPERSDSRALVVTLLRSAGSELKNRVYLTPAE